MYILYNLNLQGEFSYLLSLHIRKLLKTPFLKIHNVFYDKQLDKNLNKQIILMFI